MANLLTIFENGTFEVPAVGAGNLAIDNTIARTGVQSGKFNFLNALGNPYIIQQFNFPAIVGQIYKFDAWIKTEAPTSDDKVSFVLTPSFTEDDLLDFQTTQIRLSNISWRKISVTYKCNAVLSGESYVQLLIINGVSFTAFKNQISSLGHIVNSLSMVGTEVYTDGEQMNIDDLFSDTSIIPPDPQFGGQKLYYVKNVFLLSDGTNLYEIEEPIGWDKIAMSLMYDKEIKGFKFEFTDKDVELQFDDPAGRLILNPIYDSKGTEGIAGLKFGQVDPITNELEILFEGKINFDLFQKKQFTSVATCQRQSLAIAFSNLYSSVFTLEQNTTLNKGIAIADLTKHLCYLHSREIVQQVLGEYNQNVSLADPVPIETEGSIGGFSTVPPFHFTNNDLNDFSEPTPPDGELCYAGLTLPPGLVHRQFSIDAILSVTFTKPNTPQPVSAAFVFYKKSGVSTGTDSSVPIDSLVAIGTTFSQNFSNVAGTFTLTAHCIGGISLDADEALFVKVVWYSDAIFSISDVAWNAPSSWKFTIKDISPAAPSTFEGYRPWDVFDRMVTMMTDMVGVFNSDLLLSGCAKDNLIGSGKMVRSFPNAKSQVSMKDMLTSFDMLYNVGFSFEWDDNGNEKARLEPMEYFFQDVEMIKLNTISNYVKSPANELIFSELEFGFNKSPQQNEPGSVDEFLTKINLLTPIKNVTQKLSKLCALVMSSIYIEQARRESYQFNSNGQQGQDNDNYMIATQDVVDNVTTEGIFDATEKTLTCDKLIPVISGEDVIVTLSIDNNATYTVDKIYFRTFDDGEEMTVITFRNNPTLIDETHSINVAFTPRLVPSRNEAFDSVTGINSPGTAYNLHHQLKRIIYRWAKYFKSGFSWALGGDPFTNNTSLRFTAMIANDNLRTQLKNTEECYNIEQESSLSDIGDNDNDKVSLMDNPIFTFNKITCQAPMTWTTWNIIRKGLEGRHPDGKNYGYFTILNPEGVYEKAYLYNGTFNPNTQIANLELREKYNG